MKNKKLLTGMLVLAGSLILASCGVPAQSSSGASTSSEQTQQSTEQTQTGTEQTQTGTEVSSSEAVEYPTKVKVTQPDILIVGTELDARTIITTTPADLHTYTLTSGDEEVAVIKEDGFTIKIVGAGSTKIKISIPRDSGKDKALGNINITAASEEGLKVQQFANTIHTKFRADLTWLNFENKSVGKLTPESQPTGFEVGTLIVNPDYVLDWVYGAYSAIRLSDENVYGYTLLDETGAEVAPGETDLSIAPLLDKATQVKIGQRVNEAYLTQYFPITSLLSITDWKEATSDEGDTYFTIQNDSAAAIGVMGNIFGMAVSGYTNASATMLFDETHGALEFEFIFQDGKDAVVSLVTLYGPEISSVPVLEDAVLHAEAPEPADTTDLAAEFAKFDKNFAVDFEIGLFDRKTLAPLYGEGLEGTGIEQNVNTVGTALITDGTVAYASKERNYETGLPEEDTDYSGWTVDTENGGIYSLDPDEDGNIAKAETAISGSEAINDFDKARQGLASFCTQFLTKAVLDNAFLAFNEEAGIYTYDPSFDECALSTVLATLCPFGYTDSTSGKNIFATPENANYIECYIIPDYTNDVVSIFLGERVRLDDAGTKIGFQGIMVDLYAPGAAPAINVGDSFEALFMGEEPADEGGEEGGEEGGQPQGGNSSEA